TQIQVRPPRVSSTAATTIDPDTTGRALSGPLCSPPPTTAATEAADPRPRAVASTLPCPCVRPGSAPWAGSETSAVPLAPEPSISDTSTLWAPGRTLIPVPTRVL